MAKIFADHPLKALTLDHPIFHTVYDINELKGLHQIPRPLEAVSIGDRVGVIYSVDGLNDTAHTTGCCCCGGNEITNDAQINVNILAYALARYRRIRQFIRSLLRTSHERPHLLIARGLNNSFHCLPRM